MRAVIYTRVSTNLQEKDGTSLDSQAEACRQYASDHGLAVERVVPEIFSGAYLFDRPRLSEIRDLVKAGHYNAVIVYAIDRLTRNTAHFHIITEEFERYGVALHIVSEDFQNTAEGKFMQSVKGYVAEVEREKIRERTMRGRRTAALNGTLNYKRSLYGYMLESGVRVVDPNASEIVRRIYESVALGNSLRNIAASLNSENIPTPHGSRTWWAHSVKSILNNPAYSGRTAAFRYKHEKFYRDGVRKHNGSVITPEDQWVRLPDATPAIVSQDVWDAVQLRLQENRKTKRGTSKIEALLRGRVRCATCGRLFSPVIANSYPAYVCTSKQNPTANCKTKMLGAVKADEAVWEIADRAIRNPDELKEYLAVEPRDTKTELATLNRSVDKLNAEIDRLIARADTVDDQTWTQFQKRIAAKRSEIEKLQITRQSILSEPSAPADLETLRRNALTRLDNLTHDERVTILDALNLSCLWDGETLKVNIYAQYESKSTFNCLYNITVAGR